MAQTAQLRHFDVVENEAQRVLTLQPDQDKAHLVLGRAYLGKREIAPAVGALKKATGLT